jgi:saccharopine dehydrogenase-like NADP-dependent oxidoreductase
MTRVLVIGGAGVFGRHLAEGLARNGFDVVIAGRRLERAQATAAGLVAAHPDAQVWALSLDTAALTPADLTAVRVDIVADAAGPFQGAEPLVARAAIAAGLDYVDLADARTFVADFPRLDAAARAAGVVALTGCSSTPALSHAVLDDLTRGWTELVSVEAAISPGAKAPRGRSVMEATLSWLGRPIRIFEGGGWRIRHGWSDLNRREFGPGGRRLVSLCETPDLDLFVARCRPRESAVFRAGLQPALAHLGVWMLAGLARLGLPLPGLDALAAVSRPLTGAGDDRGAMRVEAYGRDENGHAVRAVWRLLAEPGIGPVTPSLPALATIKAIAARRIAPGAGACVGVLPLPALEAEIAVHPIATDRTVERASLFARAIGDPFEILPAPIRDLHETPGRSTWSGRVATQGAEDPFGRLIARFVGFPTTRADRPITVEITTDGARSRWTRRIGDAPFRSALSNPRPGGRVTERFGPLSFDLILGPSASGLTYDVEGWRFGVVPMPRFLAPISRTSESVDAEGRFVFDVHIALPWGRRLVHYRGWLVRET